jgi:3-hydroxy-3-methylglutaryl CoA synthase
MGGLIAYGAYIPYNRLQRSRIAAALGSGGGPGTRAVASYDEDTTSMGTEAGAIHAALRLPCAALAVDMAGAVRSGVGAMLAAAEEWKFGFVASRCEACGARHLPLPVPWAAPPSASTGAAPPTTCWSTPPERR